jgi:hypothetical protein
MFIVEAKRARSRIRTLDLRIMICAFYHCAIIGGQTVRLITFFQQLNKVDIPWRSKLSTFIPKYQLCSVVEKCNEPNRLSTDDSAVVEFIKLESLLFFTLICTPKLLSKLHFNLPLPFCINQSCFN